MIRKNLLKCKINFNELYREMVFPAFTKKFNPQAETCPFCAASGHCRLFASYERFLIDYVAGHVTKIAAKAFKAMPNLIRLTIGANVRKIGAQAMQDCRKMKTLTIKSKYLTSKAVGANALKNDECTVKCPKGKKISYQKWLYTKGLKKGSKVK